MKVALVHDYLKEYGGAERVLEALHEIWPDAPVYTAYYDPKALGIHAQNFSNWEIKTSWLQNLPGANRLLSPLRFLAPAIFESFDLSNFDLVISSCNTYFSKAIKVKPNALHLSYIHTPPRYLYGYTTSFNYKKHWWTKIAAEVMNHFLRVVDFETSQRPDILIANSKNVVSRIKKFYRRESEVIYPPIDINKFKNQKLNSKQSLRLGNLKKGNYYLSLNRLTRGKGIEVAVVACSELGLPLKIVGVGPENEKLQKIAAKAVEFIGAVKDEDLAEIYADSIALIVCSEDEDFGITAVEAQASGIPVIAAHSGGYLETIIEGKTGEFYTPGFLGDVNIYIDPVSVENLKAVLENFDPNRYKEEDLRKNAERFSKERFKKEILSLVQKNIHRLQ